MTTAFASVVGAMVAQLNAVTPVSPHIYRARMRVLPSTVQSAVVVRILGAEVDAAAGQNVCGVWATAVAVECYARSGASTSPDVAVDALLEAVVTRLQQNRSLGGLVGDLVITSVNYDFDVDGETTACATVLFSIRHATAANSILQP